MAYHSSTTRPPPATYQNAIKCMLLLVLDEELISLLCTSIPQFTPLAPLCVRPDVLSNRISAANSPSGIQPTRIHSVNASGSSLSSPEYVARLVQAANITTILIDLRGHSNELGLSCAFLTALKRIAFAGHVIYISVSGDLLKPGAESRALREAFPIHAAVEMQLQSPANRSPQGSFSWTVLGRSDEPLDSPTPCPLSSPGDISMQSDPRAADWRDAGDFRSRLNSSRSSSLSADESSRGHALEIAQGVVRAIRTHGGPSNGRKIMLDTTDGRRRSFMHQTDWRPD